jgi:transcription initiation factor TFIID subunit 6
MKLTI